MDERRFRTALDTISETIADYGEETIFAALGVIADRFGWELVKRDPGPDEENPEYWTDDECVDPTCNCHRIARHPRLLTTAEMLDTMGREDPIDLAHRAFMVPRRLL